MADSLFDNRYRYDYIYPRGRSGETLRALDTQQNERPVVIKRPAPNDAPPIRAGQEVSILNERKALTRLAGHDVLTEFLAEGQFFVGGMPHQYIVMERAQGMIIADEVLERARSGERLPALEMLVIIDHLLDLLQLAHARDIVYNDVDAKHLFWDREHYCLKVIDWGNAVFLEGDEVTPQGVSRQSDIFQVGELVYFIVTGGRRAEIPRDASGEFRLDFGDDAARVDIDLQNLISRAVHPNARMRYASISDLRRDLATLRAPLERDRDTIVEQVNERLRRDLSKNELHRLLETIEPALRVDPGHPAARRAESEINDRLRDLAVSADLDAVRMYMEGGNWSRAADLLGELRDDAGTQTSAVVALLLDCCLLLIESDVHETPDAIYEALLMIFDGKPNEAAHILLTADNPSSEVRKLQWLMAERISSRVPDVLLLRPNLYRLELALNGMAGDGGVNIDDARALLAETQTLINELSNQRTADLSRLRDSYRDVVDRLTTLNKLLATVVVQRRLPNRKLPLTALDRALNAAMALADNMHVIGKQATSSPRDAMAALDSSRVIDPTNGLWDSIERLLNNLYELLQSYQIYVPAADGSDTESWLAGARKDLTPFTERLFDEMLAGMVSGLELAAAAWSDYADSVVRGDRMNAVTQLVRAADAVGTVSPTLSGWLNQLHTVIDGAQYIERHAVHGGLGRALADGWEAFDRGRLPDAERLGKQAVEIARTETQRESAERLLRLAVIAREWVERNGAASSERSESALNTVNALLTPDQARMRDDFAAQMPGKDTYLRAMNKGLIDLFNRSSTAATRLYFFECILLGTLEAHDANLDDARFWREVAVRALGEHGQRHAATRSLEEFIERRRDINEGAALINGVHDKYALPTLDKTRRKLEENAQARVLAGGIHSLRELEAALRDWSDGEFRPAGLKLENALKALKEAEQTAAVDLSAYRGWINELTAVSAELHTLARQMRQTIERRPAEPADIVREAHRQLAAVTADLLGENYAAQLNQWHETYESFLATYTNESIRRSAKLARFNELFRAMFIDRHPAYALYRHWYDLTDSAPEFPAPPTDDPTPRIDEEEVIPEDEYRGSKYADPEPPPPEAVEEVESDGKRPRSRFFLFIVGGLVLLLAGAFVLAAVLSDDGGLLGGEVLVTATPGEADDESETAAALLVDPESTDEVDSTGVTDDMLTLITPTLVTQVPPTATTVPTDTPIPATNTPAPPTATFTPGATDTPAPTATPTITPTPTLPPEGLQGWQELLPVFSRIDELPWTTEAFAPGAAAGSWRLGSGNPVVGERIDITLSDDLIDLYFGNDAPDRIRRTDATLALTTYDPVLLDTDDVYFGLLLRSVEDESVQVGLHIQVVNLNVINLWIQDGDEITFASQRSVNAIIARVRLERDASTGRVTVFFNDAQVGTALDFVRPDEPVQPVLFVKDGGVIVNVTNWRIGLR